MDAVWGAWGEWSGCDKPCNNGSFVRNRLCYKALYGGRIGCEVNSTVYVKVGEERKPCNDFKCSGMFFEKQFKNRKSEILLEGQEKQENLVKNVMM